MDEAVPMADLGGPRVLVLAFAFALPRILGMFTVLPFMGRQTLPGMLRMGIAVSMALPLIPAVLPLAMDGDMGPATIMSIIVKEAIIGVVLGFLVALLFWAVESVGFFIDNQRGATMSSSMNPFTGVGTSPLAILLNQGVTVLFFVSGGFLLLMGGLYETYALWPIDSFWPTFNLGRAVDVLGQLDRLMYVAIVMSAPVILAMFLSELGLAMVSRFAPQLQVFFLAMPIKSAVAVLVLAIYVSFLVEYLRPELHDAVALPAQLDHLLQ